ncbi:hypothetical protein [Stenotrophomonas geniculata]|jgi:hypothetical protein|uniref:Uncharacterized protein n=1 Tax=Stenotrophomonas geniculata TaxID=86188 RepID=A0ABW1MY00_9GAMM|nr:hypothetical protein [Stenotrophomonas geniculata]MCU1019099.1 hypothetical protein [Stenotrophomonas maltophilia]WNF11153.1 hypothetical protein RKE57_03110 [Stenotrophomonas geniculata]
MLDSARSAGVFWRRRQEQSSVARLYKGVAPNLLIDGVYRISEFDH